VSATVYVLYFMGPGVDGKWFGKFMGVYSSQSKAARAVERLQALPYYRHYPKGFQVDCVVVDEDFDQSALGPPPPNPLPPPG
jgi:hypothetical protein